MNNKKWYQNVKRMQALLTAAAFLVTNHLSLPPAFALLEKGTGSEVLPVRFSASDKFSQDISKMEVPASIGKIEEVYKAKRQETGNSLVILIQDAHAIPEAQKNIQKIIEHFQKVYGVGLVALEGAASELDPQVFKSFPDKEKLKKTFDAYFENAEITGTTAAAIFSESRAIYQGIEDWGLYEKGLGFYLKAVAQEGERLEMLQAESRRLEQEKTRIYSEELLEVDRALESFNGNTGDLITVLKKLEQERVQATEKGTGSEVLPVPFSVQALLEEIKNEKENQSVIEREVREMAGEVRKFLEQPYSVERTADRKSLNAIRYPLNAKSYAFNQKYQDFQTSRISPEAFALFMNEVLERIAHSLPDRQAGVEHIADRNGLKTLNALRSTLNANSRLAMLMKRHKHLRDIQGTQFFRDFETYVKSVKESLFRNEAERNLDAQTRKLKLLEKLAKLELSRDEWEEIQSLVNSTGYSDKSIWSNHWKFYRNAEARDVAFFSNFIQLSTKYDVRSTVLIAGGFHTEGLASHFKKNGISYIVVQPETGSISENSPYRQQMQGNVSWKNYFKVEHGKVNLYEAFVRGARDRLLAYSVERIADRENLNAKRYPLNANLLKAWRDQIIRDLAKKEQLTKTREYTQFLDEINRDSGRKTHESNPEWISKINRFIAGLHRLEDRKQLTEPNVLKLLQPAMYGVPEINSQLAAGSNLAAVLRAEVRQDQNYEAMIADTENLKELRSIENEIVRNHSIKTNEIKEKLLNEINKKRQRLPRAEIRSEIGTKSVDAYGSLYRRIRESAERLTEITESDLERARAFLTPQGVLRSFEERLKNGAFGISEVYFLPPSETRNRMVNFQKALKEQFEEKIYLVEPDNLHLTTQGLNQIAKHTRKEAIRPSDEPFAGVTERASQIQTQPVQMRVSKVNWNPSIGIFWEVQPYLDDPSNDPIMKRRDAWGLSQQRPPHITAAYLTHPFTAEELKDLKAFIAQYQSGDDFGDINVSEAQIIAYEDLSFNAGYRVLTTTPFRSEVRNQTEQDFDSDFEGDLSESLRERVAEHLRDKITQLQEAEDEGVYVDYPMIDRQEYWEGELNLLAGMGNDVLGVLEGARENIKTGNASIDQSSEDIAYLQRLLYSLDRMSPRSEGRVTPITLKAGEYSIPPGTSASFMDAGIRFGVYARTPKGRRAWESPKKQLLMQHQKLYLVQNPLTLQGREWNREDVREVSNLYKIQVDDGKVIITNASEEFEIVVSPLRSEVRRHSQWVEDYIQEVRDEYLTAALRDKALKNLNFVRFLSVVSFKERSSLWRFRAFLSGWSEEKLIKETLRRVWSESLDSHHWEMTEELKSAIVKYEETKLGKNGTETSSGISLVLKEIENLDNLMEKQVIFPDVEEIVRESQSAVQTAPVVRAALGKAFQSAENFDAYIDERFAALLHRNESHLGALLQKWHKAKDPKEKSRIERQEIYPFLARINSQGLGISPEEVEFASDVNALYPSEYSRELQKPAARHNLEGKVAHQFLFWQDARDFQSRDPRKKGMYFVDFTDFARRLRHPVKTNERINPNLAVPFGPRQLIALRMRIEEDAQWLGIDPKEALARIPIILSVNKGNVDAIIEDLTDGQHNFYGFSRDNVFFTVADEFYGRTVRTGIWSWILGILQNVFGFLGVRLKKAAESPLWSAGHGYKTAQLAQPGMAFRINKENEVNELVDSNGKPISVLDHLEARGAEIMLTHHDIDLTQITKDALDLSRLTKIREMIGQSEEAVKAVVVTEMVSNPHNQLGGYRVLVKSKKDQLNLEASLLSYTYFILETIINGAEEWKRFFESKANLPYNAFRNGYAISPLKKAIMKYGIPVWIIFRDGYLYPLVLTGDLTINDYLRTRNRSYMKRKRDKSSSVKLSDPGLERNLGEEIHDVKGIGNLTEATDFIALQDQEPRFLKLARDFGYVKPVPGSRDYVGELIEGLKSPNPKVQLQALLDFKQNLGRMGTSGNESIRYLSDLFRFERPVDISVLQEASSVLGEIGQNPARAENLISWLLRALTVDIPTFDPSASDQDTARLQSYLDRIKILHRMASEVVRKIGHPGFLALERELLSASRNSDVTRLRVIMELMVAQDPETVLKRQLTELDKAIFETLVKIPSRGIGLSALSRNTLARIFFPHDLKDWLFHNEVLKPEERRLVGEILLDLGIEHVFSAARDSRNFLLDWIKKGDSGMRFLIQEVIKKMDEPNMRSLADNFIHEQFQGPMPLQQDTAERMLAVLGMMGVSTESRDLRAKIVNFLVQLLSVNPSTRVAAKNKLLKDVRRMAAESLSWIQSSRNPDVVLDESLLTTLEKEFKPFLDFQPDLGDFETMHGKVTSLLASRELMPLMVLIPYHKALDSKLSAYFYHLFAQYSLDKRTIGTDKTQEMIQKLDFIIVPYAVRTLLDESRAMPVREGAGVIMDSLQVSDLVIPPMRAPLLREFDTLTVVSVSRSSIVIRGEKNGLTKSFYIKFPVGALEDRETKVTTELYRRAALRPYLPDTFVVRELEYQDAHIRDNLRLKILDKAREESELQGVDIEKLANLKEEQTYFLFSEAGNQGLESWIDTSMDRLQKNLDPDELHRILKDLKRAVHLTSVLHGIGISHGDLGKSLLVQADEQGIRSMKFIDFALSIVQPKFDYLPEEYRTGGGFKGFGYLGNFFDDTPITMIASLMSNATVQRGESPWSIRKKLDTVTLLDHVARIAARLPQEHDMYVRFQELARENMTRLADFYFSMDKNDPESLNFVTANDIEVFLDQEIELLAPPQEKPARAELRIAVTHDVREDLIAKLKEVLGKEHYDFYLSGFSSIDIMRKGISKASAMEDYFRYNQLTQAIYFGDEFYEAANKKGNDTVLLEVNANLARQGKKLVIFSTDQDPDSRTQEAKEKTIWIGRGASGTREILRLILEGIAAGKQEVVIQGKGPDKHKNSVIRLDELVFKGALVFDADGTVLEGKEEDFSNQPEIRKLFAALLQRRVRSAIMTGNSKAMQKARMADALKTAPEIQEPGVMAGFEMYVNGGATRIRYDAAGREVVEHLSEEISEPDIQKIVTLLERESRQQYGLNSEEIGAWKAFFKFDGQLGERPDFPGFKFMPWWIQERFTPLVIEAEKIKKADPDNPLVLTEPYVEVRDKVQVSIKLFPRGLTPEGDKPPVPRSEVRNIGAGENDQLGVHKKTEEIAKRAALGILRFPDRLNEALSHYRRAPEDFIKSLEIRLTDGMSVARIIHAIPVGGGMFQLSFNFLDAFGVDAALIERHITGILDQELQRLTRGEAGRQGEISNATRRSELRADQVEGRIQDQMARLTDKSNSLEDRERAAAGLSESVEKISQSQDYAHGKLINEVKGLLARVAGSDDEAPSVKEDAEWALGKISALPMRNGHTMAHRSELRSGPSGLRSDLPKDFLDAVDGEYLWETQVNSKLKNLGFVYYLALVNQRKFQPARKMLGFIPVSIPEEEVIQQTLIQMAEAHEELRVESALPTDQKIIDEIWNYEKQKAEGDPKEARAIIDQRQWARDRTEQQMLHRDKQGRYLADYIRQVVFPRSEVRSDNAREEWNEFWYGFQRKVNEWVRKDEVWEAGGIKEIELPNGTRINLIEATEGDKTTPMRRNLGTILALTFSRLQDDGKLGLELPVKVELVTTEEGAYAINITKIPSRSEIRQESRTLAVQSSQELARAEVRSEDEIDLVPDWLVLRGVEGQISEGKVTYVYQYTPDELEGAAKFSRLYPVVHSLALKQLEQALAAEKKQDKFDIKSEEVAVRRPDTRQVVDPAGAYANLETVSPNEFIEITFELQPPLSSPGDSNPEQTRRAEVRNERINIYDATEQQVREILQKSNLSKKQTQKVHLLARRIVNEITERKRTKRFFDEAKEFEDFMVRVLSNRELAKQLAQQFDISPQEASQQEILSKTSEMVFTLLAEQPVVIQPDLGSMKKIVELTLEWLIDRGYPYSDVLKKYQEAVSRAQEMNPYLAAEKVRFGKFGPADKPEFLSVAINSLFNYEMLSRIEKLGSIDYFFESFAAPVVREAWGFEFLRSSQKSEVLEWWKRVLQEEREKILGDDFVWPSEPLSRFLSTHENEIIRYAADEIAAEIFEDQYEYQALMWGQQSGLYSPQRLRELLRNNMNENFRLLTLWRQGVENMLNTQGETAVFLEHGLQALSANMLMAYFAGHHDLTVDIYGTFYLLEFERFAASQRKEGINPAIVKINQERRYMPPSEWFRSSALRLLPAVEQALAERQIRPAREGSDPEQPQRAEVRNERINIYDVTEQQVREILQGAPPEEKWTIETLAYDLGDYPPEKLFQILSKIQGLESSKLIVNASDLRLFGDDIQKKDDFINTRSNLLSLLSVFLLELFFRMLTYLSSGDLLKQSLIFTASVLAITSSILIHEFGHFLAAKIRWRNDQINLKPIFGYAFLSVKHHAGTLERDIFISLAGPLVNVFTFFLGIGLFTYTLPFFRMEQLDFQFVFPLIYFVATNFFSALSVIFPFVGSDGHNILTDSQKMKIVNKLIHFMRNKNLATDERVIAARKLGKMRYVTRRGILELKNIQQDQKENVKIREAAEQALRDLVPEQSLLLQSHKWQSRSEVRGIPESVLIAYQEASQQLQDYLDDEENPDEMVDRLIPAADAFATRGQAAFSVQENGDLNKLRKITQELIRESEIAREENVLTDEQMQRTQALEASLRNLVTALEEGLGKTDERSVDWRFWILSLSGMAFIATAITGVLYFQKDKNVLRPEDRERKTSSETLVSKKVVREFAADQKVLRSRLEVTLPPVDEKAGKTVQVKQDVIPGKVPGLEAETRRNEAYYMQEFGGYFIKSQETPDGGMKKIWYIRTRQDGKEEAVLLFEGPMTASGFAKLESKLEALRKALVIDSRLPRGEWYKARDEKLFQMSSELKAFVKEHGLLARSEVRQEKQYESWIEQADSLKQLRSIEDRITRNHSIKPYSLKKRLLQKIAEKRNKLPRSEMRSSGLPTVNGIEEGIKEIERRVIASPRIARRELIVASLVGGGGMGTSTAARILGETGIISPEMGKVVIEPQDVGVIDGDQYIGKMVDRANQKWLVYRNGDSWVYQGGQVEDNLHFQWFGNDAKAIAGQKKVMVVAGIFSDALLRHFPGTRIIPDVQAVFQADLNVRQQRVRDREAKKGNPQQIADQIFQQSMGALQSISRQGIATDFVIDTSQEENIDALIQKRKQAPRSEVRNQVVGIVAEWLEDFLKSKQRSTEALDESLVTALIDNPEKAPELLAAKGISFKKGKYSQLIKGLKQRIKKAQEQMSEKMEDSYDRGQVYLLFTPHVSRQDFATIEEKLNALLRKSRPNPYRHKHPELLLILEQIHRPQDLAGLGFFPPALQGKPIAEILFNEKYKEDLRMAYDKFQRFMQERISSLDNEAQNTRIGKMRKPGPLKGFLDHYNQWAAASGVRIRFNEIDFEIWYQLWRGGVLNTKIPEAFLSSQMEEFFHAYKDKTKTLLATDITRDEAVRQQIEKIRETNADLNILFVAGSAHVINQEIFLSGIQGTFYQALDVQPDDPMFIGYTGLLVWKYKTGGFQSEEEERNLIAKAYMEENLNPFMPDHWTYAQLTKVVDEVFTAIAKDGLQPWQGLVEINQKLQRTPNHLPSLILQTLKDSGWIGEKEYQQLIPRSEVRSKSNDFDTRKNLGTRRSEVRGEPVDIHKATPQEITDALQKIELSASLAKKIPLLVRQIRTHIDERNRIKRLFANSEELERFILKFLGNREKAKAFASQFLIPIPEKDSKTPLVKATALPQAFAQGEVKKKIPNPFNYSPPILKRVAAGTGKKPPEFEFGIDSDNPDIQKASALLNEKLIEILNLRKSGARADLKPLKVIALSINPHFTTRLSDNQLQYAGNLEHYQFLNELIGQIYFPLSKFVDFTDQGGQLRMVHWRIDENTWQAIPYLGSFVWLSEGHWEGEGRPHNYGNAVNRFVLLDRGHLKDSGNEVYQNLMNNPSFHNPSLPIPYRLRNLIQTSDLREDEYAESITRAQAVAEEIRHAKDYAFSELWYREDFRDDLLRDLKLVEAILKPASFIRGSSWPNHLDASNVIELQMGAMPVKELSGQLMSVIEVMDKFIQSQRYVEAYILFLSHLRRVISDLEGLHRVRSGQIQSEQMFYYWRTGELFMQSLSRTKLYQGKNISIIENILSILERGENSESLARKARNLLYEIFQMHFWNDQERADSLRLEDEELQLMDPGFARSEIRAATHIIDAALNNPVSQEQLNESAGVVVRVGVDTFVETLRSEVRRKMKELEVTQNEQPVQVTPEIVEMALNGFTNSLLKHVKGTVSFGIDRDVNPTFVNAFRRVKSSIAELDRLWLQRDMAKDLDSNDLKGVNAQFVGRWGQYKPADGRPLPVAVGTAGASVLDSYDYLLAIRGVGHMEGEVFFEELADAVDLLVAARLGTNDLIRKISDLQDPAKRTQIRAALIREFFYNDPNIVTDDGRGFSINRVALFKRIIAEFTARAEIRKSA